LSKFAIQSYALIQSLSCSPTPEFDTVLVAEKCRAAHAVRPSHRGTTAATTASPSTGAVIVTTTAAATASSVVMTSTSDLLFRAQHLAFAPRAFAKRLLIITVALEWLGPVTLRAPGFVAKLVAREPRLEALLSTEDCALTASIDYDPMFQLKDPRLSNLFREERVQVATASHGARRLASAWDCDEYCELHADVGYKIQTDAQYNGMRDNDYMISKITRNSKWVLCPLDVRTSVPSSKSYNIN
jgi:hypothetical protein